MRLREAVAVAVAHDEGVVVREEVGWPETVTAQADRVGLREGSYVGDRVAGAVLVPVRGCVGEGDGVAGRGAEAVDVARAVPEGVSDEARLGLGVREPERVPVAEAVRDADAELLRVAVSVPRSNGVRVRESVGDRDGAWA